MRARRAGAPCPAPHCALHPITGQCSGVSSFPSAGVEIQAHPTPAWAHPTISAASQGPLWGVGPQILPNPPGQQGCGGRAGLWHPLGGHKGDPAPITGPGWDGKSLRVLQVPSKAFGRWGSRLEQEVLFCVQRDPRSNPGLGPRGRDTRYQPRPPVGQHRRDRGGALPGEAWFHRRVWIYRGGAAGAQPGRAERSSGSSSSGDRERDRDVTRDGSAGESGAERGTSGGAGGAPVPGSPVGPSLPPSSRCCPGPAPCRPCSVRRPRVPDGRRWQRSRGVPVQSRGCGPCRCPCRGRRGPPELFVLCRAE